MALQVKRDNCPLVIPGNLAVWAKQEGDRLSAKPPPCSGESENFCYRSEAYFLVPEGLRENVLGQRPSGSALRRNRYPSLPVLTGGPSSHSWFPLGMLAASTWDGKLFSSCLRTLAEDLKHFLKINCLPLGPTGFLQFQKKQIKNAGVFWLEIYQPVSSPFSQPGPP